MKPTIQPLGIGDLKLIKTRLARYEPGEVAHIENVLAYEERKRMHRRMREIEEFVEVVREREEESRRDLQSTERFELETEVENTARSETRFEAGLELSASYGPVSLGVFARFSSSESKEQSDRAATKYAKEVTDKTVQRVLERTREERRVRSLEQFEETNEHGFENESAQNITGVYRWVDKFYRAKVVNYGKRLLYEFVVPEPAAYYVWAQQQHYQSKVLPVKPAPPRAPNSTAPLTPPSITRWNYLALAQQYGLEGVDPPPPANVVIGKALARDFQAGQSWSFANEDLEVPRGYTASWFNYRWSVWWDQTPSNRFANVNVGTVGIDLNSATGPNTSLGGLTRKIGVSAVGYNVYNLSFNLQVYCDLISEHFQQWQLRTYQAVMAAYKKALMEYEERLAALEIRSGQDLGDNPLLNRETELEQLEWLCLTLWSADALQNPAGVDQTGSGLPSPNVANASANATKIEFFEEAFEWRNLTYEIYPYFWGRTSNREERFALESNDPLFERFLRSGAARVVVPVRPSYTERVLWYQLTGTIWSGGPVPALTSTGLPVAALYNSYVEDMEDVADVEELDAQIDIGTDDPTTWLIKLPTNLVWLQEDGDLPNLEAP